MLSVKKSIHLRKHPKGFAVWNVPEETLGDREPDSLRTQLTNSERAFNERVFK